ncbi:Putative_reverse transcriptase/endonuclease [Hexamita inflata]|uniref:Reverse transcriptase/endonuclease n=1 Tax=Hexamita inflata TaxID=28002 RepID=A0AA86NHS3_9EUKA|nr:Putative reverse transcriptase/endonuclease [Hexamita inflata]
MFKIFHFSNEINALIVLYFIVFYCLGQQSVFIIIFLKFTHSHPRPVDKAHGNLPQSDKLEKPDIEFQYATYVLDVTFVVEANICNTFKGKILKYGGTYGDNRMIPLVLRYNGTVYEKSMNMLTTFLPEITDSFLSKHCFAVARQRRGQLHYTSLITNTLHKDTIATKQGQRDRQATGRRTEILQYYF